jgi:hypothetical protein
MDSISLKHPDQSFLEMLTARISLAKLQLLISESYRTSSALGYSYLQSCGSAILYSVRQL